MINRNRMVKEFIELVKIDSLSLRERQMADKVKEILASMGYQVEEDDAGQKIGGNCGNLICRVKGTKAVPTAMVMAHLDTVTPGINKKPVLDGDFIKSDGTTILGGDDLAGVECILETLRVLKEQEIEHGDLEIVFTVAEEIGLMGSKNLDYDKFKAKYSFVFDGGGPIGVAAITAPSQNKIDIFIKGKAAHAGMEPEKGISAITVASKAISQMKLGRIDDETTANIGIITGGLATNIVCEVVEIKAEARSRNPKKLEEQTQHMKECFENVAEEMGARVEFMSQLEYPSYNISPDAEIIDILRAAAKNTGLELVLEATGGGSDTNIVNGKGIQAVDLSIGMDKVHSVDEQINIIDMIKAASFLVNILKETK